jgi:hypothetical protein
MSFPRQNSMYLLCILSSGAGKKSVISFLNRANPFRRVCLFCISVRNKIYVLEMEMLEPVIMARKHKSGKAPILMLDCMISQVSCGL